MKRSITEMLAEGLKDFSFRVISSITIDIIFFVVSVFLLNSFFEHNTVMRIIEGSTYILMMIAAIIYCFFLKL